VNVQIAAQYPGLERRFVFMTGARSLRRMLSKISAAWAGTPWPRTSSRARRLPWADLLRRVFAEDVLHCPCGGHRSITAFVVDERLARSLLTTLGLAA
jgi:hypothetical protein